MFERVFRIDLMAPTARISSLGSMRPQAAGLMQNANSLAVEHLISGGSRDVDLVIANVALGTKSAALDSAGARGPGAFPSMPRTLLGVIPRSPARSSRASLPR